jgi:hypothetical protein
MATIKAEFLDDRAVFHCCYTIRPGVYKMDDEKRDVEILYANIDKLSKTPSEPHPPCEHKEFIIPKINRTVFFVIDSWQEHSMGPNEENVLGPYLKE